jgi:hypothetical protein
LIAAVGTAKSAFAHPTNFLLNPGREQDPIRTVRGAGYALDDRFDKVE